MPFKSRHVILYTAGIKNLVKVKLRQDVHDKINFSQILSKKSSCDKNNLYSIGRSLQVILSGRIK